MLSFTLSRRLEPQPVRADDDLVAEEGTVLRDESRSYFPIFGS